MSPTFQNPIIRGFNPDPTVCVVRNATVPGDPRPKTHYYLSTSTFEYFPGCAVYHSTDLINWDLIGHALTRRSQVEMRTVEPGAGSWASTLRYNEREERFYLANGVFQRYRPASDAKAASWEVQECRRRTSGFHKIIPGERIFPRGFYVWTDNIWKPDSWSDPVYFDNPGFDQDLFWDDATSKVYLSTTTRLKDRQPSSVQKDFAIHISEIDLPTGRTLTPPVVIRKSHHGIAEGSHIFRRGEYHYLLTAEGGTEAGHQEWIFRSREGVHGPWEDRGQALWYNGPTEEVQRTGHVDIFEGDEGAWWGVFLGVRPVRVGVGGDKDRFLEPPMGRETFLVKVDWVDDWPVFNDGGNITLETKGRGAVRQLVAQIKPGDMKWTADLSKEGLELGWYQKNTPLKKCYTLTERPGYLRMHGNCYDLSSPEAPAMLLRKQSSYTEVFHAKLQFSPTQTGYEAGMVLWWSQYSYASVGITLLQLPNGRRARTVICRQPTDKASGLKQSTPLLEEGSHGQGALETSGTVNLKIEARPTEYKLSLSSEDSGETELLVPAGDLTVMPPVGGAFCVKSALNGLGGTSRPNGILRISRLQTRTCAGGLPVTSNIIHDKIQLEHSRLREALATMGYAISVIPSNVDLHCIISIGQLRWGTIRRGNTTVSTYCLIGGSMWSVGHGAIRLIRRGNIRADLQRCPPGVPSGWDKTLLRGHPTWMEPQATDEHSKARVVGPSGLARVPSRRRGQLVGFLFLPGQGDRTVMIGLLGGLVNG
ncbi:putative Glycosyl hydrolase [Seiridium cardinale]